MFGARLDLSRYASDGPHDISCSGITRGHQVSSASGRFSVSGCVVSFYPIPDLTHNHNRRTSVWVTYTSSGGDTHRAEVNFYSKSLHLTSIIFTVPEARLSAVIS